MQVDIKYKVPSTWSGGEYGNGDTIDDNEAITLTAPDGFVIHMAISRLVRGWTQDSPAATVLAVQNSSKTDLTWVIVNHDAGTSGPVSLQIANTKDVPTVGSKKFSGTSIYKIGEVDGAGVYLEIYGGYSTDMNLNDFNNRESVRQAKAIFESVSIGI